ncbi:MAG: SDR family oxidoreductase [Cytophagales bacterium]|nr:SDR family oxidoreductase [Cytophagales bacterium]
MNILITGGASGLGEAITNKLAKDHHNKVFFTYNNSKENAEAIKGTYANAEAIHCDFRDRFSLDQFIEQIDEMSIDVLVNNAISGMVRAHAHKITIEDYQKSFEQNVLPTIAITNRALKGLRKRRNGKIITILSADIIGNPTVGMAEYTANKAYLMSMVKQWATENIKFNVSSMAISPSLMKTNIPLGVDDRIMENIEENHPLKGLLPIEDVAEAIAYFSTSSSYTTGINHIINAAEKT